jgi:hypothetical protein
LPAGAETVLLAKTGLISGKQSFVIPLEISHAGRLSVSLADMNWAGRLADLSFTLVKNNKVLFESPGSFNGMHMFELSGPGAYSAYVSGTATGKYGLGLYSLCLTVNDLQTPVPLPATGLLLLSALSGLFAWRRSGGRGFRRVNIACVA